MKILPLLVSMLLIGCNGCTSPSLLPDVGSPVGVITWSGESNAQPGIDQASIYHLGTLFIIWSDFARGGGGNDSSDLHGVSCQGSLIADNGAKAEFTCKSSDGLQGTAVIDGQAYDLANGFLVRSYRGRRQFPSQAIETRP